MIKVRPLVPGDVETIVWMGAMLADESPVYREMHYSPTKTRDFLRDVADPKEDGFVGWVIERKGAIVGFLTAYTSEHTFFLDTTTWDGTLYVHPHYRGKVTRHVFDMVRRYVEWAEQWGGPIFFGVTTDLGTDKSEALLKKAGFITTGRVMQYVRQ